MSKSIPQILETALAEYQKYCPAEWSLADELRALRRDLDLSQEAFAKRYAIPVNNLRNWEQPRRGTRPDAAARLLIKMIKAEPERVAEIVRRVQKKPWPEPGAPGHHPGSSPEITSIGRVRK
jgi:DNA-binding transcriptional regulator YiaG